MGRLLKPLTASADWLNMTQQGQVLAPGLISDFDVNFKKDSLFF